jgi:hypothetical protein
MHDSVLHHDRADAVIRANFILGGSAVRTFYLTVSWLNPRPASSGHQSGQVGTELSSPPELTVSGLELAALSS